MTSKEEFRGLQTLKFEKRLKDMGMDSTKFVVFMKENMNEWRWNRLNQKIYSATYHIDFYL